MRIFRDKKFLYPFLGKYQEVAVHVGAYEDGGSMFLQLICIDNGEETEPWMTCSVNMPAQSCPSGEVWIKDYSENEGCAAWLIKNEIIEPEPTAQVYSGYVIICRYKFTQRFMQECTKFLSAQRRGNGSADEAAH